MGVTAGQYAEIRGRSKAWVSAQIKAGMPVLSAGKAGREYEIEPSAAIDWEVEQAKASRAGGESQRDRLAKEQADKVALENAVRRGELAKVAHFRAIAAAAISHLNAELDGIAGRLANELAGISDPAEIRGRLLDQHRAARAAFADRLRELGELGPGDHGAGGSREAAAAPDAKRVGRRKPSTSARKPRARSVPK